VEYVVGIDLGTTFCAAAVCDGRAEVFSLGNSAATIPSVVYQRGDGQIVIGEAAERRAATEPWRAAREFKRRLGDPTPIVLGGTPYSAESLLAQMYQAIVAVVAERRGAAPTSVVVTHPAYYGAFKLDLLREAVRMAGIANPEFISEPVAAAAHYAGEERVKTGESIAVYDFGGGTFDAAVLRKTDDSFEVVGTPEGLAHLGGIDFDEAVFAYVRQQLAGSIDHLDESDPAVLAGLVRLRRECTAAKEALSADTDVTIPVLLPAARTTVTLTRDSFEEMIRPRLGDTIAVLERALAGAGVTMETLDRILLVGGSSRIPLVRRTVEEATGRRVTTDADPKFSVALGAALAGARDAAIGPPAGRSASGRARPTLPVTPAAAVPVTEAGASLSGPPQQPPPSMPLPPMPAPPMSPPPTPAPPMSPPPISPPAATSAVPGPTDVPEGRPAPPPAAVGPESSDGGGGRRGRQWAALAAVGVVVALVGAALVFRDSGEPENLASPDTTSTTYTVPTTAPAPPVTRIASGAAWRRVHDAPTARQQLASAQDAGTLWVFGGLTDNAATAKVEGYDAAIDTWKSGPDLPLALHHEMAVTYNDELVVLGGWSPAGANLTAVTSDRVFALRRGSWVELPRLNRPRAAGAAVVVGDKLVVVGGQYDGRLVATTEVFDGTTWRDVAPIPTLRDHLAAVADGQYVYAVGGRALSADKNTAALERYDPAKDSWQKLPDMPTARGGLGAGLVGRRIVALGGESATGVFETVESFDLDLGTWTSLPAMGSARHGLAVVVAGSSVYAIGGATEPTHAKSSAVVEVLDLA
jgi:actin-like ATPase involved in cell morphogenesis/N-acetylneuraminic acid mutarotase